MREFGCQIEDFKSNLFEHSKVERKDSKKLLNVVGGEYLYP